MSSSGLWPAPVLHPGACNVADCSKRIHATADDSVSARHRPAERPANATAKPGGYTNRPTPITSRGPTKPNESNQWRARSPGYWKRPKKSANPTGDSRRKKWKEGKRGVRKRGQFLILYNLRLTASCDTSDGSDNRACPSPYARRSTPPSSSSPPPSARSSVSATPPETSPRLDTSRAESA